MASEQWKSLTEKAMQCLHLARAINDRYPDPTKMPAEDVENRKRLVAEAHRLKGLAQIQHEQDELDGWAAAPAEDHPALKGMASAAHSEEEIREVAGNVADRQYEKAFFKWVRHGMKGIGGEEKALIHEAAQKADLVENAAGEVLVPQDVTGPIFKTLPHLGVFRGAGPTIRNTTSDRVDIRSMTSATAGWNKLETGGTPVADANVVAGTTDTITVWDLMALSRVGVDELADSDANLGALIQEIVGLKFAEMEDDAFAFGTGTSQPWGLARRATVGGLITQAVTAAANATITPDDLKKLPYQVPSRFRNNGGYLASPDAAQAISLLKDSTSNYLWQPSLRAGEPDTLFGKRFDILEGLPSMGASAAAVDPSVIFGDLSLGYMVAQRQTITMQRLDERYAELGLVGFLFKMRVGGDVIRPAAFAKYLL